MADLLKEGALLLMTEECYDNYFINFNFFHVECFKALLSKGLGIGIIAGSILVKVPQIIKILANKSGEGINVYSVFVDLLAITVHVAYSCVSGFPFSAWGDGMFLIAQTAIIGALVLHFSGATSKALLFLISYSALCYVMMSGLTPIEVLWGAQACNVPIIFFGKMIQAVTNYRQKSTGQLSAVTCFMLFAGSIARIFTSHQETGDPMMILTYCVSSAVNAVIVSQMLYYWNSSSGKGQRPKKEPIPAKDIKSSNSGGGAKTKQTKPKKSNKIE